MPYLNDPRRRITLNFHPADYDALTADAARAGHASAYAYVMALVQARGAALRPVVDAHGAQRVARFKTKLAAAQGAVEEAQQAVATCRAARAADADRYRALEKELAGRPDWAHVQQMLEEALAQNAAERAAATPSEPTPEETARAARRAARRSES